MKSTCPTGVTTLQIYSRNEARIRSLTGSSTTGSEECGNYSILRESDDNAVYTARGVA